MTSCRSPLSCTLILAVVVALAGCGGRSQHLRATTQTLLPHLRGARGPTGSLIIDETHGRFASLRLGMLLAAAKKSLPAKNLWSSMGGDSALSYCSYPAGSTCGGAIYLGLFGACEIGIDVSAACASPTAAGPLVEIDLGANGNPLRHTESDQAVTRRGIHLGSPSSEVLRRYSITDQSTKLCGGGPRPAGVTYVALAGKNTITFTVHQGVVQQISLIAGKHPHLCHH